jgi:hypothetical protein
MPDFVYNISATTLGIYFAVVGIAIILFGLLIVKPILRLLMGTGPEFNHTVNFATSGVSLFYALLLGLLTVAAYQNSERIKEGILGEATTLGVLYADMNSYPEPMRSDLKSMMRDYVLFTIYKEWPSHKEGKLLNGGYNRADAMRRELARFEPQSPREEIIHAEVISAFQQFSEARQRRLTGVVTEIPNVLWYAVLIGATINMLLIVILKMRVVQHIVLGTITASFLGVILFVIVSLDQPLRGESGLEPEPLRLLWERAMVWDEPLH